MTSPCELHIYSDDALKSRNTAKKILEMAKKLEAKYNFYDPNSYLSALNQRKTVQLDPQTKDVLNRAKQFYTQTNGIFDITMGTLAATRKAKTIDALEEETQKLMPYVGVEHFQIKKDKIVFDNPYTLIDLGGMIKEYAVDQALKILKKEKIKSALVNFGGDIYALGRKPDGKPFRIGIKNPINPSEYITGVELENKALTTSASYERNYTIEEKSFSHILHKEALQEEVISATVISDSVLTSGIFSTALMINPQLKMALPKILITSSLEIIN